MKKAKPAADDLRPEYVREDFGTLVRGKYAARLRATSNVVVLRPEVAVAFPNGEAVNDALMGLLKLAQSTARTSRRASGRAKPRR